MAFDDAGQGRPVLLVHGFPTSRALWREVTPALVAAGMRAIAPDLLGYGDSPSAPDVGMEAQAGALLALLESRGLAQADVVAHDVGTAAAQLLAVRAPGRVRTLVLMDGVYETEWAMDAVESIRAWDDAQAARLQPVLARRLKSIRALLGSYGGEAGGRRLIRAARALDPRQTEGITPRLRATGLPIAVIWGAQDAYLPPEKVGRPLAQALGAALRLVPGGHFLPVENPAGTADAILAALPGSEVFNRL